MASFQIHCGSAQRHKYKNSVTVQILMELNPWTFTLVIRVRTHNHNIWGAHKQKWQICIMGSVPNLWSKHEQHIKHPHLDVKFTLDVNVTFDWLQSLYLWFRNIYKLAHITFLIIWCVKYLSICLRFTLGGSKFCRCSEIIITWGPDGGMKWWQNRLSPATQDDQRSNSAKSGQY